LADTSYTMKGLTAVSKLFDYGRDIRHIK
jgi:hypothetical protein